MFWLWGLSHPDLHTAQSDRGGQCPLRHSGHRHTLGFIRSQSGSVWLTWCNVMLFMLGEPWLRLAATPTPLFTRASPSTEPLWHPEEESKDAISLGEILLGMKLVQENIPSSPEFNAHYLAPPATETCLTSEQYHNISKSHQSGLTPDCTDSSPWGTTL